MCLVHLAATGDWYNLVMGKCRLDECLCPSGVLLAQYLSIMLFCLSLLYYGLINVYPYI